jgi:carbon-monoxide dehydrogenase medium subunit
MVGVYVAQDGKAAARVAVTGAGPGVFRQAEMEAALSKKFKADALLDGIAVKPRGLNSDMHASAAYRAHLISVMAKRAVAAAK